jgi:hypothetical protein
LELWFDLAESREPERAVATAGAGIVHVRRLLRGAGILFDGIVALANRRSELLAETFGRLTEFISALRSGLREGRVGKMSAVANTGAIFLDLNLAFEIGGHLIEFANYSLKVVNLSRLLFDFPTLQADGQVT